ncbi:hypothetical protein WN48_04235 [Eufriesea mexicana]|uniref:uncharacterized protein LOC108550099 n=1 Tax=Eufriesea mexicana TaxID=516756 RepID=UPI00083C57BB|nr:PREDICTED: uncharacterized protein LOC108550099 [Eufriesea mexicana]OAD55823.1 hypothetical protein WN48_04235 [Eufriesea mexicana]
MRNSSTQQILKDEECFEIIRKRLHRDSMEDFSLITYEVIPIDEVNGFMGQYFTLKATVASPQSPLETKSIKFFTKLPPPATSPQYDFMQQYGSFRKEVALYTTVFPEVLNGLDKRYIPECFLGLEDDVIVLEDMAHNGYEMPNKFKPFDFQHCKILMKTLARFHAKSLVFEELYKKSLHDEFPHCLQETLWPLKDGRAKAMFDAAVKGIVSLIDLMPDLDEDQRKTFTTKVIDLCVDHANKLLPSKRHKNVLCHGDLWANNILFKYGADQKPVECCLIDFQLARYNPPAHDILCFLQFTTTRQLRDEHSEELFEIYHESMTEALHEAGLDISTVFPWNDFLESIKDLRLMCIMHGVLNIPIMLIESSAASKYFSNEPELLENILYVDRTSLLCEQMKDVPEYRDRMMDALLELYDHVAG